MSRDPRTQLGSGPVPAKHQRTGPSASRRETRRHIPRDGCMRPAPDTLASGGRMGALSSPSALQASTKPEGASRIGRNITAPRAPGGRAIEEAHEGAVIADEALPGGDGREGLVVRGRLVIFEDRRQGRGTWGPLARCSTQYDGPPARHGRMASPRSPAGVCQVVMVSAPCWVDATGTRSRVRVTGAPMKSMMSMPRAREKVTVFSSHQPVVPIA
jgi:hypothetical protein